MEFPNGLPAQGATVEVKTVWDDQWHPVTFQGIVSGWWPEKGRYSWFGAYAEPSVTCAPIVTDWRYAP